MGNLSKDLEISTSVITLNVKRNGVDVGEFTFNPKDVRVATKVFTLEPLMKQKDKEYQEAMKNAKEMLERSQLTEDYITWNRKAIDNIWGDGTSQLMFGDTVENGMFDSFLEAMTKYYNQASDERTAKYIKE